MSALLFTIPGQLVPWARPRVSRNGGMFSDPRVSAYKSTVRAYATQAVANLRKSGIRWPSESQHAVIVIAHRRTRQRWDVDRGLSTILDAMTGIVYPDDRAAYVVSARIVVGSIDPKRPRTHVLVWTGASGEREAEDLERLWRLE